MPHPRKKGGVRKDKKVARMRKDLEMRKELEGPKHPSSDQNDIQAFKPGGPSDRNRPPG